MDQTTSALATAIERYLAEHPNASDSVEGVHRWWLGPHGEAASHEVVARALAQLVDRGVVDRHPMADGRVVFALRRPHRAGG